MKLIFPLMLIVLILGGCGTNNTLQMQPGAVTPTSIVVSPTSIAVTTATTNPIISSLATTQGIGTTQTTINSMIPAPSQLNTIEANAEEMFDNVNQGNWAKASQQLASIKLNFNEVNPLIKLTLVPASLVSELSNAIVSLEKNYDSKKTYEAAYDSNHIAKCALDISQRYKTSLPVDFGRLSYYGRQIVLNGLNKDWTLADNNFSMIKDAWSRVKVMLDSTYKGDISDFDAILLRIERTLTNKSASYTNVDFKALFDKIDVLIMDYWKQNRT